MTRAAAVEHEGPSIWGWGTAAKILRKLRLTLSRRITPLTEDILAARDALDANSDDSQAYAEIERRVQEDMLRWRQCPAGHPVAPFEIRATIDSDRLMFQVFPNAMGSPTGYVPIRFWLCVVCQGVYRQRELEEVGYTQAGGAAPSLSGLSPEEAIRRGRD